MKDIDIMPFGKYKGQCMANIPASYLIELSHKAGRTVRMKFPDVFEYIKDNKEVLQ